MLTGTPTPAKQFFSLLVIFFMLVEVNFLDLFIFVIVKTVSTEIGFYNGRLPQTNTNTGIMSFLHKYMSRQGVP